MDSFWIDENNMIDLDKVSRVRMDTINEQKFVIVTVDGEQIIVPFEKHKEFFNTIMSKGVMPSKQFVSL
jgi:hypothetical protein